MSSFEDKWGDIDNDSDENKYGYDDDDESGYRPTFDQEKTAIGQKNIAGECASSIVLPDKNDKDFRRMKSLLTPEDNFKYDVDKISQYLNENENINLDVNDRNEMCRMSSLVNIDFFNAATYVIAYWVTNGGGREIDKKKWKKIFTEKNKLINVNFGVDYEKKTNIYPADVIRYARFIIKKY